MVRNYLMLVAGVLSIFFGFGHAWYGYGDFIPSIGGSALSETVKATSLWIWHLQTMITCVSGAALIYASLKRSDLIGGVYLGWFIIVINIGRYFVFGSIVGIETTGEFVNTLSQAAGVAIYVGVVYRAI